MKAQKSTQYQYLPGMNKSYIYNPHLISVPIWYVQKWIPVQHWFEPPLSFKRRALYGYKIGLPPY
jgi:hypothetical protein